MKITEYGFKLTFVKSSNFYEYATSYQDAQVKLRRQPFVLELVKITEKTWVNFEAVYFTNNGVWLGKMVLNGSNIEFFSRKGYYWDLIGLHTRGKYLWGKNNKPKLIGGSLDYMSDYCKSVLKSDLQIDKVLLEKCEGYLKNANL